MQKGTFSISTGVSHGMKPNATTGGTDAYVHAHGPRTIRAYHVPNPVQPW